ncbi:MAG: ABC transporter permease [Eubacteriaceae bacterium]|nr:ABC transporter permease [Eubacteriaceae bacterium]
MKPTDLGNIPAEKLEFAHQSDIRHDVKFETKPLNYFQDAWLRFRKNKSSVIAFIIIIMIVLFAFLTPLFSRYPVSFSDGIYSKKLPKNLVLSKIGIATGTRERTLSDKGYAYTLGIGIAAADTDGLGATKEEGLANEFSPIVTGGELYTSHNKNYHDCVIDDYLETGFTYMQVTQVQYEDMLAWQEETGRQLIYPMVDISSEFNFSHTDANYWYKTDDSGNPVNSYGEKLDINKDELEENYLRNTDGSVAFYQDKASNMKYIRVLYYNYFIYKNGHEPAFLLGTDGSGYDILVRLASGTRLSLLLAVCVSAINLTIGAVYGAVEGYYGGLVDLILERVSDIISGVPFIIVATLFQLHLVATGKVSTFMALMFAFVLTGWLNTAYNVRTQFYRFKNQEYVLAARTLGAKDLRVMFKHIFPNALGTIITSSVLVIPSVIFSESMLSYLGIANMNSSTQTSLGTMLANGQQYLSTFPHIIFFPAVIISLLMISFNLFGNGLRDAFNPTLRGSED